MRGTTLITGADGYLGSKVATALLAGGEDALVLTVRARDADEFSAKRDRLEHELGTDAAKRVKVVAADIRLDDALTDIDPRVVTRIVHTAAITRFNVDYTTAREVNLDGAARVCAFALRCNNLQRFVTLSTLYSAGRRQGMVKEVRHDDVGFANNYEWSKWAAEEYALDSCADLPLSVLRLPTLIADDEIGYVTQYNAFHNTLKLYFYGLLSLVPGNASTPLTLATASFATAAIIQILDPACPDNIYHVCPDPPHNATLGQLIEIAFRVFERSEHFRRRRILRPAYCSRESFDDLLEIAEHLRGGPINESLGSVSPFAHQLYLPKEFCNDTLRAAWPGYSAPNPADLIEATTVYLVASRWGRYPWGMS